MTSRSAEGVSGDGGPDPYGFRGGSGLFYPLRDELIYILYPKQISIDLETTSAGPSSSLHIDELGSNQGIAKETASQLAAPNSQAAQNLENQIVQEPENQVVEIVENRIVEDSDAQIAQALENQVLQEVESRTVQELEIQVVQETGTDQAS